MDFFMNSSPLCPPRRVMNSCTVLRCVQFSATVPRRTKEELQKEALLVVSSSPTQKSRSPLYYYDTQVCVQHRRTFESSLTLRESTFSAHFFLGHNFLEIPLLKPHFKIPLFI